MRGKNTATVTAVILGIVQPWRCAQPPLLNPTPYRVSRTSPPSRISKSLEQRSTSSVLALFLFFPCSTTILILIGLTVTAHSHPLHLHSTPPGLAVRSVKIWCVREFNACVLTRPSSHSDDCSPSLVIPRPPFFLHCGDYPPPSYPRRADSTYAMSCESIPPG